MKNDGKLQFTLVDEEREFSFDHEGKLSIVRDVILNQSNNYLVSIQYFNDTEEVPVKRIDYSVGIVFLEGKMIRINKHDLFFNRKEPTMVIEQIVSEFSHALYPMEISLTKDDLVDSVINDGEIKDRWGDVKNRIQKEYKGKIANLLIKNMEADIYNPTRIAYSFSQDMFWSVFLGANNTGYVSKLIVDKGLYFPLEAYQKPLLYKGVAEVNPKIAKNETLESSYVGKAKLPVGSDLYRRYSCNELTSELRISYILDQITRLPIWINTTVTVIDINEEVKKVIKLSIAKQN